MTTEEMLELFENLYIDDCADTADDAATALAGWVAEYYERLPDDALVVLLTVGAVLYRKGNTSRMEAQKNAVMLAHCLIENIRTKK